MRREEGVEGMQEGGGGESRENLEHTDRESTQEEGIPTSSKTYCVKSNLSPPSNSLVPRLSP